MVYSYKNITIIQYKDINETDNKGVHLMTKGRVDNRDVWGFKEENHSTSSSSLLYCKTKHHLRLSNVEHHNIDTHHIRLILIPSQIADDDSLIHKNKEYANILH